MAKRSSTNSSRDGESDSNDVSTTRTQNNGSDLTKTSLIIVSKNERLLSETLDALESDIGRTLSEVLVVDASNGALDDIRRSHEWARWIDFEQPRGVPVTIAHQRNDGVQNVSGDIIVFTDSGCLPEDGWLGNLLAPI